MGALEGIRILDLSRVLAGPYCTMILGDLGAEVIKVEAPCGSDDTRNWGPPFKNDVRAYYIRTNPNTKRRTLGVESAEDLQTVPDAVHTSEVIINNFKTGTMERVGHSYEKVAEMNPKIV